MSDPTRRGDATWLARVQALLAKAESTEFPDEAEALVAKAQDLMARHAIDHALLDRTGGNPSRVITATVQIEAPYATAKASLLGAVASANSCRCVSSGGGDRGLCHLVGHETDVANVETLYASLSLQAVRAMLAAPIPPGDTARRFRHAFLLAFAARIGQRLDEVSRRVRLDVERSRGPGTAVVLADRSAEVDRALSEAFPRLRRARYSSSSPAGHVSGRRAADQARLGGAELPGRRTLGHG